MSITSDDKEFVIAVVEKAERVLSTEIGKLHKQVQSLKAQKTEDRSEIQQLHVENRQLNEKVDMLTKELETFKSEQVTRAQDSQGPVLKTIENAFRAGLHAVIGASGMLDVTPALDLIQGLGVPTISSSPILPPQEPSVESPLVASRLSLKRKTAPSEAPTSITSMEQLPDKIRRYLEPHYSNDAQANKDKLNNVQRAFVKAKTNEVLDTGASINSSFIYQVMQEGREERIWATDFSPSTDLDFDQYLTYRFKNEKKSLQKKRMLATTRDRIDNLIADSIKEAEGE